MDRRWKLLGFCLMGGGCKPNDEVSVDTSEGTAAGATCMGGSLWECADSFDRPCDAWWWEASVGDDADQLGPWEIIVRLSDVIALSIPMECVESCESENVGWSCESASCVKNGMSVDYRREWATEAWQGSYDEDMISTDQSMSVVLADVGGVDGNWSLLRFSSQVDEGHYEFLKAYEVAWTGVFDDSMPDGGSFDYVIWWNGGDDSGGRTSEAWSAPGCTITGAEYSYYNYHSATLTVPGSVVVIETDPGAGGPNCDVPTKATLHGQRYEIEDEGWVVIGEDNDGDGFSETSGDCDDSDDRVSPCEGCQGENAPVDDDGLLSVCTCGGGSASTMAGLLAAMALSVGRRRRFPQAVAMSERD